MRRLALNGKTTLRVDDQDLTLEQWARMLNDGGGNSLLFRNVTVRRAVKKIGEIGKKRVHGVVVVEEGGYKLEVEFEAGDFEAVRQKLD